MEYSIYGRENIDPGAIAQMNVVASLACAVSAALMPDAHLGIGMPIGGIIACDNAVIPASVGVDIGCRMSLTVFDLPGERLEGIRGKLHTAIRDHTAFGMGGEHKDWREHDADVFEHEGFEQLPFIKSLKHRAWQQLGSSGGGNHFVEFGVLQLLLGNKLGLPEDQYLALLSHSGSRGFGAKIADFYTKQAMQVCRLPDVAKHLAYLSLDSELGQEYWLAMNVAGDYAKANHDNIHKRITKAIGYKALANVDNHHNFAWKEQHNGRELIVHRKGATPAGEGVMGFIPGSMASPGYLVTGKGEAASLMSASHGAGRLMSRRKAKETVIRSEWKQFLEDNNVTLIGGDLDEAPAAYKDIQTVMTAQADLVEVNGIFLPRVVRMADDGFAED